ncbi:acyl-CoA dehydrogenase family protein [Amycolatopsis sp. VS8301801F10]|uniref:acyl-CoA dehydrogenase family protein n=1 Tax=Amycolatopsis sp. VS8301801F10 TaxID=2652442 RepID=UPI0038FCC967
MVAKHERVRPRVREFEADDVYPAEFIDAMRKLGFFGLLAPAETMSIGGGQGFAAVFERVSE